MRVRAPVRLGICMRFPRGLHRGNQRVRTQVALRAAVAHLGSERRTQRVGLGVVGQRIVDRRSHLADLLPTQRLVRRVRRRRWASAASAPRKGHDENDGRRAQPLPADPCRIAVRISGQVSSRPAASRGSSLHHNSALGGARVPRLVLRSHGDHGPCLLTAFEELAEPLLLGYRAMKP